MQVAQAHSTEKETGELQAFLAELALEARIPVPEIVVVQAPAKEIHAAGRRPSLVSTDTCRMLGDLVASHSKNSAAVFLTLPPLPTASSLESNPGAAHAYLECLDELTARLPATILCKKSEPMDVLSSDI